MCSEQNLHTVLPVLRHNDDVTEGSAVTQLTAILQSNNLAIEIHALAFYAGLRTRVFIFYALVSMNIY